VAYERGAYIGGEILAGSDWILRDPTRWWSPGDFGTRPKGEKVTVLTGHWTAGEAGGARRANIHGPRVFDVMKHRKSAKTGGPLNVSVAFVIGAPVEPDDPGIAPVWQFLDPGLVAGVHVGRGWFNRKSIGVEVISGGLPGKTDFRKRPQITAPFLGKDRTALIFYPAQIRAWLKLADMLTGSCLPGGIEIPRKAPAKDGKLLTSRRFTVKEAKRWEGCHEHFLTPGTTKVDAFGMLMGALVDHGWDLVEP